MGRDREAEELRNAVNARLPMLLRAALNERTLHNQQIFDLLLDEAESLFAKPGSPPPPANSAGRN